MLKYKDLIKTPYFSLQRTVNPIDDSDYYFRISSPDSVVVGLLDTDDKLILVKQHRHNLGYTTLEFAAGAIEPGENPEAAAYREIKEETGQDCSLLYLGGWRTLMNRMINKEHLFFGICEFAADKLALVEDGVEVCRVDRRSFGQKLFSTKSHDNIFEQIAALGLIKLLDAKIGVSFFSDDYETIHSAFSDTALKIREDA